jgi:argininosuccinate synthase
MEDPWAAPPPGVWTMTVPTATEPREVVVAFEQGKPVALDGAALPLHELIHQMNGIVGAYGWGRLDMVENRRVGIKSREPYECPAALALLWLMPTPDIIGATSITKARQSPGMPARLRRALVLAARGRSDVRRRDQRFVTGEVRCAQPGRCFVNGRRSPHSLYDHGSPPRRS